MMIIKLELGGTLFSDKPRNGTSCGFQWEDHLPIPRDCWNILRVPCDFSGVEQPANPQQCWESHRKPPQEGNFAVESDREKVAQVTGSAKSPGSTRVYQEWWVDHQKWGFNQPKIGMSLILTERNLHFEGLKHHQNWWWFSSESPPVDFLCVEFCISPPQLMSIISSRLRNWVDEHGWDITSEYHKASRTVVYIVYTYGQVAS